MKPLTTDRFGREVFRCDRADGRTIYVVTAQPKGSAHSLFSIEHTDDAAALASIEKLAPKCDQPDCRRPAIEGNGDRWACEPCRKLETWGAESAVALSAFELRMCGAADDTPDIAKDEADAVAVAVVDAFKRGDATPAAQFVIDTAPKLAKTDSGVGAGIVPDGAAEAPHGDDVVTDLDATSVTTAEVSP
jgi:hypothetical protein